MRPIRVAPSEDPRRDGLRERSAQWGGAYLQDARLLGGVVRVERKIHESLVNLGPHRPHLLQLCLLRSVQLALGSSLRQNITLCPS